MSPEQADQLMAEGPVVALTTDLLHQVKKLRDRCLAADIPAVLGACVGKT